MKKHRDLEREVQDMYEPVDDAPADIFWSIVLLVMIFLFGFFVAVTWILNNPSLFDLKRLP